MAQKGPARVLAAPGAGAETLAVPGLPDDEPDQQHHHVPARELGPRAAEHWWNWDRATGSWGGLRRSLQESGLTLEGFYVIDGSYVLQEGVDQREAIRSLLDFNAELDLERALGLRGASVFAEFYSKVGRDGSLDAGDVQAYDNLDGPNVHQLAELWWQQTLLGQRLRLKLGKVDANSEFACADAGLDFLHSSAGFSPTLLFFPTYPDPAVSLNVEVAIWESLRLRAGLYNSDEKQLVRGVRGLAASFDAIFWIGELDAGWGGGRAAAGVWYHDGALDRWDGGEERGTTGFYGLLEQTLVTAGPEGSGQGLRAFVQYGWADEHVSPFGQHLGAGLTYTGALPTRERDVCGLYVSHVDLSDQTGAGFSADETAFELFYKAQLTPFLVLQPDLQVIVDPSGRDDIHDALVATLRLVVDF